MPNGSTHKVVGAVLGGAAALARASTQSPGPQVVEGIGGALGGWIGGQVPDLIEPAISPQHRGFVHSVAAGTTVVVGGGSLLSSAERHCRARAEHYARERAASGGDGVERFLLWLAEMLWRLAAGFTGGLVVGFGSHLALDAFTPRGLPLLAR